MGDAVGGILVGFIIGGMVGLGVGANLESNQIMKQAHELGIAEQCLGMSGYHFECPESE